MQASVASESTSSSQYDPSTSTLGRTSPGSSTDVNGFGHGHAGTAMEGGNKIAYDPRDLGNDDSTEGGKMPRLTILEEVLLLGLKDKQVSLYRYSCYNILCMIVMCLPIYHFATCLLVVTLNASTMLTSLPGIPFLLERQYIICSSRMYSDRARSTSTNCHGSRSLKATSSLARSFDRGHR